MAGTDFLDLDTFLSDEEKLTRQTARRFTDEHVMPVVVEANRSGKFPMQLIPPMAELGFFGANLTGLRLRMPCPTWNTAC